MALYLEEFVNEQTLKPLAEHRIRRYEDRAIAFLHEQFAPETGLLSDDDLRKAVQLAYGNARRRGIRSERDHLKYLIPVMFWGSHFETDPQYHARLVRSGWLSGDGKRIDNAYLGGILHEVDEITSQSAADFSDPVNFERGFAEIYQAGEKRRITLDAVAFHLARIWPARYRLMPQANRDRFIKKAMGIAYSLNFGGMDAVTYTCLSLHFGYRFAGDPLFSWAARALADDGRSFEERRLSLGNAIIEYWNTLHNGQRA